MSSSETPASTKGDEECIFMGVIDNPQSKNHGKPVVLTEQQLYKVVATEDIEWGVREKWRYELAQDLKDLSEDVENFTTSTT